jgi:hypothetical protein
MTHGTGVGLLDVPPPGSERATVSRPHAVLPAAQPGSGSVVKCLDISPAGVAWHCMAAGSAAVSFRTSKTPYDKMPYDTPPYDKMQCGLESDSIGSASERCCNGLLTSMMQLP